MHLFKYNCLVFDRDGKTMHKPSNRSLGYNYLCCKLLQYEWQSMGNIIDIIDLRIITSYSLEKGAFRSVDCRVLFHSHFQEQIAIVT